MLMLSEVVPILFPFLAVIARRYYRRQVLQDKVINPPTEEADKLQGTQTGPQVDPSAIENFGGVQLMLLETAALTEGTWWFTKFLAGEKFFDFGEPWSTPPGQNDFISQELLDAFLELH